MNCSQTAQIIPQNGLKRIPLLLLLITAVIGGLLSGTAFAQSPPSAPSDAITLQGTVRNASGEPMPGAVVRLTEKNPAHSLETITSVAGKFSFTVSEAGVFTLTLEKAGFRSCATSPISLSAGEKKQIVLVLQASPSAQSSSSLATSCTSSSPGTMEFEDKPNFTVAGVTDWSGAGGHGSDTTLRTSEAFARETLALKSDGSPDSPRSSADANLAKRENRELENKLRATVTAFPTSFEANHQLGEFCLRSGDYREAIQFLKAAYQISPENLANSYDLAQAYKANGDLILAHDLAAKSIKKTEQEARRQLMLGNDANRLGRAPGADGEHQQFANFHRFMGDLDEQLSDPLGAVREYERAATLDPSEPNYFEWGTELLLHRAVSPAVIVFQKGSLAYPHSSRMLVGLGAALYAGGSYGDAAHELCLASDLKPEDTTPYLFLGKMEVTLPDSFPCSEQKLSRFLQDQPQNARANYYFAMTLLKRDRESKGSANLSPAQALLEKSVNIDPKLGEAYLQLGVLYSAQGAPEKAIAAYTRAIEVSPNLSETHYRLSQVYKRMGDKVKADQEIQLYKQVEKTEEEEVERQRHEVQQFLIILKDQPAAPTPR